MDYLSYSEALALAIQHYGERWYHDCIILSIADVHSTNYNNWVVRAKQPSKGTIRPSSST